MKRLFLATIALFVLAGGTFWFMSTEPKLDAETMNKIKMISRYKQMLPKAEAGDIAAQYAIAQMLEHGDGVKKDVRASVAWYQKAADQGHAASQYQMGWMFANGIGLRQDYHEIGRASCRERV